MNTPPDVEEPTDPGNGRRSLVAGDLVLGIIVVTTSWWYLRLSSTSFFQWDDWSAAARPGTVGDLLEPYNGHLSVVPLLAYRALLGWVGFESYLPYRLLGIAALAGVVVSLYALVRHRLGSAPALVASAAVLWMTGTVLTPFLFNFHLALLLAVVCAAALPSTSRRADVAVGATIAVSLCTSSVGVGLAAAGVGHALLVGARPRRLLATALPVVAWAAWWVLNGGSGDARSATTVADTAATVIHGMWRSSSALFANSRTLGALFLLGGAAVLVRRLTADRPSARTQLAWAAALVVWWIGLAWSRTDPTGTQRYAYVGAVFVLLSLVPARPARRAVEVGNLPQVVAAATVAVVLLVAVTGGSVHRIATIRARAGDDAKALLVELEQTPARTPDAQRLPDVLGRRTVAQHRQVIERYGLPAAVAGEPDEVLLGADALTTDLAPVAASDARRCTTAVATTLRPGSSVTVQTADRPVEVRVRRFGDDPTLLRKVPADHRMTVTAGKASIDRTPWRIEASGGCLVES